MQNAVFPKTITLTRLLVGNQEIHTVYRGTLGLLGYVLSCLFLFLFLFMFFFFFFFFFCVCVCVCVCA